MTDRLFNAWMHKFDRGTDFHQTHPLSFQICVCTNILSANVSPPALKTKYEELGCQAVNFSTRTKETPQRRLPYHIDQDSRPVSKEGKCVDPPAMPSGVFCSSIRHIQTDRCLCVTAPPDPRLKKHKTKQKKKGGGGESQSRNPHDIL